MKVNSGNRMSDILNGLRALRTTTLVKTNSSAATSAAIIGVMIQARIIDTTPPGNGLSPPSGALYHTTESAPAAIIEAPTMDPTIECVVETGSSRKVASASHRPDESIAQSIMYISNSGEYVYASTLAIPLRIVDVTPEPSSMAPPNSKIAATMTACRSDSALEPTEVANELATSLAPIPHATKRARKIEQTKIHV